MDEELTSILDAAVQSGPFQRLLAAPGPTRAARADGSGHAFTASVMARALDAPILLVGHDPRAAEALAAGAAAFLGPERVVRFPSWESLPYEGISPGPQAAGARAEAAARLRRAEGALVVAAPVLAVLQGLSPTLGRHEPLGLCP